MSDKKTLQKHLAELRSKSLRKANNSEQEIRRLYKELLKDLQGFIATEYAQYAQDGKLSYSILQQKGEYARFMQEVTQRLDGITPEIAAETLKVVNEIYDLNYSGMIDSVATAKGMEEIAEDLKSYTEASKVQRSVKNSIFDDPHNLVLKESLEYNRQGITYNIKRNVSIGLVNGDRYEDIAKRISTSLDGDYKKSIRIARTETHRVQEQGLNDAAVECSDAIKNGTSGLIMVKIWRTGKDQRVRDSHASMEGVTVLADEEFKLPSGAVTMTPGDSGNAGEDINCRCYCSYKLMTVEEYEAATGKKYGNTKMKTEAPTLKNYEAYSKAKNDQLKEALDKEEKGLYEEAGATLKKLVDNNDFNTRMDADTLDQMIKSGRFKSQFETGTSKATKDAALRKEVSKQLFGVDPDTLKDKDFEKYGYLGSKDKASDFADKSLNKYGDIIVTFKKGKIQDRTTMICGDSLINAEMHWQIATPVMNPQATGIAIVQGEKSNSGTIKRTVERIKENGYDANKSTSAFARYYELQMHGDITLDDIDCIYVKKATEEQIAKWKKVGLKVKVTG